MKTLEQRKLPPFGTFANAVASAHPEISFTPHFLRSIYGLAKQRLDYEQEAREQIELAARLRKTISRLRKAVKNARKMQTEFRTLQVSSEATGFSPSRVYETFEPIEKAIQSLIDVMESNMQSAAELIFPTRAHELKQRLAFVRFYDLPRLGYTAAYSWFIVSADKMLTTMCKRRRKALTKKLEWAILRTILAKLFKERTEVEAIERLVRAARKKNKARAQEVALTKPNF
jgi:hypothetical protein